MSGGRIVTSSNDNMLTDTALMISWLRARYPDVSLDRWGSVWASDAARAIGEEYGRVTGDDNIYAICLRHRYFAEVALAFADAHDGAVRIFNVGSGLTAYPFLMPANHESIEIDLPEMITVRRALVQEHMRNGTLPERNIRYASVNLEDEIADHAIINLVSSLSPRPTLWVLEGLLYYLTRPAVEKLLRTIAQVGQAGDQIALVAWGDCVRDSAMFEKIDNYFQERLQRAAQEYTFLERDYFESLDGFTLRHEMDYPEIETKYLCRTMLSPGSYLDERMYLLQISS